MLLANQGGWLILNPATVRVKWDGGANLDAIDMQRWQAAMVQEAGDSTASTKPNTDPTSPAPDYIYPMSHFGAGIITWVLPYLFRTPPGYNLLVRGPANQPKDGVAPLEGLVETDWTPATFTMNWQITRPDTWITFEQGEPLCLIAPQRRGDLEQFTPEIRPLADNPVLQTSNAQWCESRDKFNTERRNPESAAAKGGWERHYIRGTAPDGSVAPEHQTKLRLQQFTRRCDDVKGS